MILEDIKTMLGIEDTLQDNLLTLYLRKAIILIRNYLKVDETIDIETVYPDAIIEYVTICKNKKGNEGLKSYGQGSRSGTYGNDMPDSVKALLPLPFIKMRG